MTVTESRGDYHCVSWARAGTAVASDGFSHSQVACCPLPVTTAVTVLPTGKAPS